MVPCLSWYFKREILVKVRFRLKNVSDEELGQIYIGPEEWEGELGFRTPLVLLPVLARGDHGGNGVSVVRRSAPLTTFAVDGFDEEVVVHDDFARFIKKIAAKQPLQRALLSRGLIDEQTSHSWRALRACVLVRWHRVGEVESLPDALSSLKNGGWRAPTRRARLSYLTTYTIMVVYSKHE